MRTRSPLGSQAASAAAGLSVPGLLAACGTTSPTGPSGGSFKGRIAGTRGHAHYTASGAQQPYYHPGDLKGGARVGLMAAAKAHGQRGQVGVQY